MEGRGGTFIVAHYCIYHNALIHSCLGLNLTLDPMFLRWAGALGRPPILITIRCGTGRSLPYVRYDSELGKTFRRHVAAGEVNGGGRGGKGGGTNGMG